MLKEQHVHLGNNSEFTGPPDPDCFICKSIEDEASDFTGKVVNSRGPEPKGTPKVKDKKTVPLKFDDQIVGHATIDLNGNIVGSFNNTRNAQALGRLIRGDYMEHISLSIPAARSHGGAPKKKTAKK